MTEKLYQGDSYLREMDAVVLEKGERNGRPALLLDRTVFYPTSGGQMHDTGHIEGVAVEEVQVEGEAIWHLLAAPVESATVHGAIDWPRRFDFMQQHTGFHLLAGAFYQGARIRTLSAHLGEEVSTIEVDAAEVPEETLEEIESLANRVIWEDRRVTSRIVDQATAEGLQLRKAPQVKGAIRLIEIADFDLDPCGGTHVSSTGQVGMVKIIGREKIRQGTRYTFVAGGRAWRLVQDHARTLAELTGHLTTDAGSLTAAVIKLQEENKGLRKSLELKTRQLAEQSLEAVCAAAGTSVIISHLFEDVELETVRYLAAMAVRRRPGTYLFAGRSARAALAFATSTREIDLRPAFTAAIQRISGRGGGEPGFVQGSGNDIGQIEGALQIARAILENAEKKD